MPIILRTFFLPLALCLALASMASAQTVPQSDLMRRNVTVLVFSDDADLDAIPRDNRIFNRVIARIQESLNLRGFQVFDETATTQDFTDTHRVRRIDAEVIEIARSITPPINVAVVFQIYASVVRGEYQTLRRTKVRIAGRMLNVRSGQFMGSFEVSDFTLNPLPRSCADRDCLLEEVGKYANDLAVALGETLADKLEGFVIPSSEAIVGQPAAPLVSKDPAPVGSDTPLAASGAGCVGMPDTFIIRFKEFEDDQVNQFETLLASFGCYTHHSTIRSHRGLVEFTYDTSSGDARLSRNLRLLMDYVNTRGNVQKNGNIFEVTQVRTR